MEHRASHSVANLDAVSPPRIANSLHEDLVYIYRNVKGSEQAVAHFITYHGTVSTPATFELGFVRMDPKNPAARAKPHPARDSTPLASGKAPQRGWCNRVGRTLACLARWLGQWCGAHPHRKGATGASKLSSSPCFVGETLEETYVQNMFLMPTGENPLSLLL